MQISHRLERAASRLRAGPHPERARRDAESLLLSLLGKDRAFLIAHGEEPLDPQCAARYDGLIGRRLEGEPIQYITGEAEFFGLGFRVTRDVLIPRPETEHAVEKVLDLVKVLEPGAQFRAPRIVDVGTGSGAIGVALAVRLPEARITATDLSARALTVARENAARNGVEKRIRFLEGDLAAPVGGERFEVVVSNPPYVRESERAELSIEVREFEPAQALFAGTDGLDVYRRLIPEAAGVLVRGGWIVLEIGCGQHISVGALLEGAGFGEIGFTADLQGIARVASARRR